MYEITILSNDEVVVDESTKELIGETFLFVIRAIRRQRKAGRPLNQILRDFEKSGLALTADQSGLFGR